MEPLIYPCWESSAVEWILGFLLMIWTLTYGEQFRESNNLLLLEVMKGFF